jgi:pimeloyl-ACP methyl ester carboxylesterase
MQLRSAPKAWLGLMRDRAQQEAPAVFALGKVELFIVEFDDQGCCYDRRQMHALVDRLEVLRNEDVVILTFVHGWKHNASGDDDNLKHFCTVLREVWEREKAGPHDRPVIGIFVAWRGLSLYGLKTENLTFWDRKQAGTRVATGSVRELLGRLRQFRLRRQQAGGRTVLVIVGHSFGGMIVFSAIAQSLIEAATTEGEAVPSFANLVLLVNPAFEAVRYLALHCLVEERAGQRLPPQPQPVFVSITAANDDATGFLFPLGMAFALAQESTTTARERAALWHTMGHLPWLRTHELTLEEPSNAADETVRRFGPATLRRVKFGPENPFWVVRASPQIINRHGGIFLPPFLHFLQELVFDHLR